jgi:hypothetical protein
VEPGASEEGLGVSLARRERVAREAGRVRGEENAARLTRRAIS